MYCVLSVVIKSTINLDYVDKPTAEVFKFWVATRNWVTGSMEAGSEISGRFSKIELEQKWKNMSSNLTFCAKGSFKK